MPVETDNVRQRAAQREGERDGTDNRSGTVGPVHPDAAPVHVVAEEGAIAAARLENQIWPCMYGYYQGTTRRCLTCVNCVDASRHHDSLVAAFAGARARAEERTKLAAEQARILLGPTPLQPNREIREGDLGRIIKRGTFHWRCLLRHQWVSVGSHNDRCWRCRAVRET